MKKKAAFSLPFTLLVAAITVILYLITQTYVFGSGVEILDQVKGGCEGRGGSCSLVCGPGESILPYQCSGEGEVCCQDPYRLTYGEEAEQQEQETLENNVISKASSASGESEESIRAKIAAGTLNLIALPSAYQYADYSLDQASLKEKLSNEDIQAQIDGYQNQINDVIVEILSKAASYSLSQSNVTTRSYDDLRAQQQSGGLNVFTLPSDLRYADYTADLAKLNELALARDKLRNQLK